MPTTEPYEYIHILKQFTDIELFLIETNCSLMSCRFLPHDDQNVCAWISRDLDSTVNDKERAAVIDWLEHYPGKDLHIMTDNSQHTWPLLGGMIGFRNNHDFSVSFKDFMVKKNNNNQYKYGLDCHIANDFFLKEDNYIQHHSAGFKHANSKPFPKHEPISGCVGNIVDIDKHYNNLCIEDTYPCLLRGAKNSNARFMYSPWKSINQTGICVIQWDSTGFDFTMECENNTKTNIGTFKTENGDGQKLLSLNKEIKILWENRNYKSCYMPNEDTIVVIHGSHEYVFTKI
tara:strand:- start:432 stop:1295 length:864 start_codon:yes stop_codon:yes gene_type:complete